MGDLLWHEVRDDMREEREKLLTQRGDRQGVEIVSYGHSVWGGPDKVSVTFSCMHALKPKGDSPKRAYRWQTTESFGFRRLATGTIVPYRSYREATPHNSQWRNSVPLNAFTELEGTSDQALAYQSACKNFLGIRDFGDLYPAALETGISKYMAMPWMLRGYYRAADVPEFTARAFGKTRVSNRLIKAVEAVDPITLAVGYQMRGLVETKKIANWMVENSMDDDDPGMAWQSAPNIRKVFLHVSPETMKAIVKKPMDDKDRRSLGTYWFRTDASLQSLLKQLDKDDTYQSLNALAPGW